MYLIERYIMSETRRLVMIIVGFLIFMFASYSAQRYLTEAANGTLALGVVLDIVFYKVLIALEMLLPVGLYVSVAVALGQLYNDSEITAIFASGSSPFRLYKAVLILAVPLAILVTVLSMYGRPWAYAQIYTLEQQSQSELDVSHLLPRKFNVNDSGRMVLAQQINSGSNRLSDALIYNLSGNKTKVFRAHAVEVVDPSPTTPSVVLHSGTAYVLDHKGSADNEQTYNNLNMHLKPMDQAPEARRKSTSSAELSRSTDTGDIAELQWRESRGVSALLMALMAIPLSRTKPRQGRYATLLPLAIVFTLIFYGGNICRTLAIGVFILIARELSLLQKFSR
jgi:lipopolysaccharide export system permease protein